MHRSIRENLEEVLAGSEVGSQIREHFANCEECGSEVEAMREQARLLRNLRASAEDIPEPRPGFYARVMERIEAQGAVSIWSVFGESAFGRRLAVASMALALLLGTYLVTIEQSEHPVASSRSGSVWDQAGRPGAPDRDAVLVNLVTYREQ